MHKERKLCYSECLMTVKILSTQIVPPMLYCHRGILQIYLIWGDENIISRLNIIWQIPQTVEMILWTFSIE